MQTKVTSNLDTTSTLSITALALTQSTTRAFRLEHSSRGRTMIPQANDNKNLTQIRTHQVDKDPDTYSKEVRTRRGTSRGLPTTPALLRAAPHTLPSLLYKETLKEDSPLLLFLSNMLCMVRVVGGPLYSLERSIPTISLYGNVAN